MEELGSAYREDKRSDYAGWEFARLLKEKIDLGRLGGEVRGGSYTHTHNGS